MSADDENRLQKNTGGFEIPGTGMHFGAADALGSLATFGTILTVGAAVGLAATFPLLVQYVVPYLMKLAAYWPVRIVFIGLIYWIARQLLGLRTNHQDIYGQLEICVGLVTCWVALSKADPSSLGFVVANMGGTYIIVRGLVNTQDFRMRKGFQHS